MFVAGDFVICFSVPLLIWTEIFSQCVPVVVIMSLYQHAQTLLSFCVVAGSAALVAVPSRRESRFTNISLMYPVNVSSTYSRHLKMALELSACRYVTANEDFVHCAA
jgi:hypothetical protein